MALSTKSKERTDMALSIYVAGGSNEMERAEHVMAELRAKGFVVTSDWPEVIKRSGVGANPENAPLEQRTEWAATDAAQVDAADLFWLLVPERNSFGASWEFGYANAKRKTTWATGRFQRRTIFTALATFSFDSDSDAFDHLVDYARKMGRAP